MPSKGNILFADDEDTFLQATADLLRLEGYDCAPVADGYAAAQALTKENFDLLICDIRMAGNAELELVKTVNQIGRGISVIIVTGYPALTTAIEAVELPVLAYLVKPLDFSLLLKHVEHAVARAQVRRAVSSSRQNLADWRAQIDQVIQALDETPGVPAPVPVEAFMKLTFQNITHSLSDLAALNEALHDDSPTQHVCALLNCPRSVRLTQAIHETIRVLEATKSSFKSKELADLRKKLERLVDDSVGGC